MAIEGGHEPVMTAQVVEFLAGRRTVVDMTLGSGGHAAALLEAGVSRLVGVDRDPEALALAGERLSAFGERVRLVAARFSEVDEDVVGGPADGVLFDLGVSSMQLDRPESRVRVSRGRTARYADGRGERGGRTECGGPRQRASRTGISPI